MEGLDVAGEGRDERVAGSCLVCGRKRGHGLTGPTNQRASWPRVANSLWGVPQIANWLSLLHHAPDRGVAALKGVPKPSRASLRIPNSRVRQAGLQVVLSTRTQDGSVWPQATQRRVFIASESLTGEGVCQRVGVGTPS